MVRIQRLNNPVAKKHHVRNGEKKNILNRECKGTG